MPALPLYLGLLKGCKTKVSGLFSCSPRLSGEHSDARQSGETAVARHDRRNTMPLHDSQA